jgi:hypothetical protein
MGSQIDIYFVRIRYLCFIKTENSNMGQERIYNIEKRVAELKFLERDLIKERDIGRMVSLGKAEKSDIVWKVVKNFFIDTIKADRKELIINSFPSKFTGRDDEEFLSEVKVEVRFKPLEENIVYNELSLQIYLNNGFQDDEVQKLEKDIMERLLELRKDVDELKESKKSLKQDN